MTAQMTLPDVQAPGPRPVLPGQNLLGLMRNPLHFIHDAAQYGDVVRLNTSRRETYLLSHPDMIRDVLVTHHRQFKKSLMLQRMRSFLGDGLLTSEGELHLRQRRLIQPAFHRQRLAEYAATITGYAQQVNETWKDKETVDVHTEMMRLTMVIVGKTLFGTDVEKEAAEIGEAITILLGGSNRMMLPFWERIRNLPLPGNRRLIEAGLMLDERIRRMITERREAAALGETGLFNDLMDVLLRARDEQGDGQGMSDQLVRDEVMTLFLAGHETTANALTWTWYLLSQHPEFEARLHEELDRVLGGRMPRVEDMERLPYTRQVLSEAMRLYPSAWIVGREATTEFRAGSYLLPAGSTILMSQWIVHRDPRWFPEPLRFDPDRWRAGAQETLPKFAYFPFGGGPRLCIGEPFAWMEGMLVLAGLGQCWKLRLAPGQVVDTLPQITLRPRYGMRMEIHRR